jgi:pyruvate,orthophosphate dikinase
MDVYLRPTTFNEPGKPSGRGIGIHGGAFRGLVAFNKQDAERLKAGINKNDDEVDGVLLLLENPVPDEIPLIISVDGLLSSRGGSTSHAAVCVHGIEDREYSAVLGVPELRVMSDKAIFVGDDGEPTHTVKAGDVLSIHGQTGEVYIGSQPILSIETGDPTAHK